jgi:signal transduction histidine kinase
MNPKFGPDALISAGCCRLFIWLGCFGLFPGVGNSFAVHAGDLPASQPSQTLTNICQFHAVFSQNNEITLPFHLIGTITMVDTNRDLFVLQDATGVMAVNLNGKPFPLLPGQLVSLQGTRASPYFASFPKYPYQPSGWDIRNSFEAPSNWGEYHLTRMRGYLHPPLAGDYTFWIASDNSSELWLSSDDEPGNARKIAFIKAGDFVNSREWSRYPSQRSETINLRADQSYYIEAVSEQLLLDENLAVAWQSPGFGRSVIDGRYLTPWIENQGQTPWAGTNGILREYWTNYTLGGVVEITARKPFESMLAVKEAQVTVLGQGTWPEPRQISLDQPLLPENNYRWVKTQGTIDFIGADGTSAILELTDGQGQAQVRVSDWKESLPQRFQNRQVEVEGVCEGMQTVNGYLMPGVIWTPTKRGVSFIESSKTNYYSLRMPSLGHFAEQSSNTNQGWSGFFSIRGVVTFNDQVLGRDCLYIQDDAEGIYIYQGNHHFNQLQIGQGVDVGGTLLPGRYAPSLDPIVVTILGRRPMPQPVTQPVEIPVVTSRNGQWTELEGVIRSINTNGTMVMMGKRGGVSVWVGQTPGNVLNRYVDSTLRLRGVLSLVTQDDPILLVPSRGFVDVEDQAPADPFEILPCNTTGLNDAAGDDKWIHRVKIEGVVTYRKEQSLFVQDAFGGVRVEFATNTSAKIGDKVEVAGFPGNGNVSKTLTDALVRVVASGGSLSPRQLDLNKAALAVYRGTLVRLEATFLAQKTRGSDQVLDLQERQHFYEAVLSSGFGQLPSFEPGSRLEITGVCDVGRVASVREKSTEENVSLESVRIFLRSPQDVIVQRGPPWWTWKGFVLLAGVLVAVIIMGLLLIHLLRRRLERAQTAKFIFSRQILKSQEDERRRIAINLHDTLGQNLLFIKNQSRLALQMPDDKTALQHRLDVISETASHAIEEVRQITHNLRPYQLDRLGLTQAVRAIIKQVSENSQILFANHVDDIDRIFDEESEIHVYRIVQESLNNIVKHSGATEATVVVKRQTTAVLLSIRDNGQGFDSIPANSVGMGLNGITERVWILGGKSTINSSPGQGTNLTFEIPTTAPPK